MSLPTADLLARISAELISGRTESEVRNRAVEQFRAAGISARFVRPHPTTTGDGRYGPRDEEETRDIGRAFSTGSAVFGAAQPPRVYLPLDAPEGREVLVLQAPALETVEGSTLALFSRVVSAALANGRMISDLERLGRESLRQLADTQLLLDLARTTSGTLELREILDAAGDFLVRLLDVSNCFILLYDAKSRVLQGAAASSAHREFIRDVVIPVENVGIAGTAARELRPVIIEDTSRWSVPGRVDLVRRFDEKALLALPLVNRGELLGVVVLDDSRQPRPFPPELVQLAQASIGQLALSVVNARLYQSLREAYSELAKTRAEMLKRERLAALGELAAVVAHEVRNPLGVIFNAVSSLRRLVPAGEDTGLLLGIISEESERLNRIVGDMLDYSRPSVLSLQLEDVERLVRESVDAARADLSLSEGVTLRVELPPDLPRLPMDRHLLRQALVNVVVNALQAVSRGGTVWVRARVERGLDQRHLRLEVTDDGPGIPPELVPRIFEPFFTTKARGTGLGLAVVRRIVEDHRGEVQVRSEPGRGTTFSFRLPLLASSGLG